MTEEEDMVEIKISMDKLYLLVKAIKEARNRLGPAISDKVIIAQHSYGAQLKLLNLLLKGMSIDDMIFHFQSSHRKEELVRALTSIDEGDVDEV